MTRDEILAEMFQVKKDLDAFNNARDVMGRRMGEMELEDPSRLEDFEQWAVTQVVMNGFTLALDIPIQAPHLFAVLDQIDEQVIDATGRIYLSKDARLSPLAFRAMYPRYPDWLQIKNTIYLKLFFKYNCHMNKTKLTIDEIADINPEAMLADGFDAPEVPAVSLSRQFVE